MAARLPGGLFLSVISLVSSVPMLFKLGLEGECYVHDDLSVTRQQGLQCELVVACCCGAHLRCAHVGAAQMMMISHVCRSAAAVSGPQQGSRRSMCLMHHKLLLAASSTDFCLGRESVCVSALAPK